MRVEKSFCRICNAHCGMILTVDDDERIVSIRGDKAQPMSNGYACFKGLQADEAHHGPQRLLRPLKRQPDGSLTQIGLEQALDEIAAKVREIIARDGAEAISLFNGNGGTPNSSGYPMTHAFMAAIGSPSLYSTLTIDQSAKIVAGERMGAWGAGLQDFSQSDVLLFIGTNPLVSHSTVPVMGPDPVRRMKAAKARGMKLVVVDPRKTETAVFADLFLQPVPGQDVAILAGLIRMILAEGWEDKPFCAEHVGADRLAILQAAVEPFTELDVALRAGIAPGELRALGEMFARNNHRGAAYCATGPCMAPFSNVTQHLVEVVNVICGRLRRVGDSLIVDLTAQEGPIRAQVYPATRSWEFVPPSRIRGVGKIGGERTTGTLSDEILTPGPGQIKVMFVNGANPATTIPDQRRFVEALRTLELIVVVDPVMTVTASLAHYILPPRMQYERADLPLLIPNYPLQPVNWLQMTSAVISPPTGSELTEDWYVYWSVAKRLGVPITFAGEQLSFDKTPTTEEILAMRLRGARVSYDQLKQYPSGALFENEAWRVQSPEEGADARFDVMPRDVAQELADYRAGATADAKEWPFLLSSRRLRDTFNSNGTKQAAIRKRNPYNPLFANPDDIASLGVEPEGRIEIASEHGAIVAIIKADPTMRRGVVAMSHGWGGLPDDPERDGDSVNLLVDCARNYEAINAMPHMSAIPVRLTALANSEVA